MPQMTSNGQVVAGTYHPQPQVRANGGMASTGTRRTIIWVFSVVVLLLLFQVPKMQPALIALSVVVVLGLMLRMYPTIATQFSNLGK